MLSPQKKLIVHLSTFFVVLFTLGVPNWGFLSTIQKYLPLIALGWSLIITLHFFYTFPSTSKQSFGVKTTQDNFERKIAAILLDLRDLGEPLLEIEDYIFTIHRHKVQIENVHNENDKEELLTQKSACIENIANSTSETEKECYENELRAINQHIMAVEVLQQERYTISSKERELLHQLEGLRICLLTSKGNNETDSNLGNKLEQLLQNIRFQKEANEQTALQKRKFLERKQMQRKLLSKG